MPSFEWDDQKEKSNRLKHGVSFTEAQNAFFDPKRIMYFDVDHSTATEKRYFCVGKVDNNICTVRFTYRNNIIRIIGAGYWRKERALYVKKNK
jgi:uncharacterized DUF497 family protein